MVLPTVVVHEAFWTIAMRLGEALLILHELPMESVHLLRHLSYKRREENEIIPDVRNHRRPSRDMHSLVVIGCRGTMWYAYN